MGLLKKAKEDSVNKKTLLIRDRVNKSVISADKAKKTGKINESPTYGQRAKTIKTFDKGQIVRKQKQGKDIFGRETTKDKTYIGGKVATITKKVIAKDGVEKSTFRNKVTGVTQKAEGVAKGVNYKKFSNNQNYGKPPVGSGKITSKASFDCKPTFAGGSCKPKGKR